MTSVDSCGNVYWPDESSAKNLKHSFDRCKAVSGRLVPVQISCINHDEFVITAAVATQGLKWDAKYTKAGMYQLGAPTFKY